jgi:hypothetical protein
MRGSVDALEHVISAGRWCNGGLADRNRLIGPINNTVRRLRRPPDGRRRRLRTVPRHATRPVPAWPAARPQDPLRPSGSAVLAFGHPRPCRNRLNTLYGPRHPRPVPPLPRVPGRNRGGGRWGRWMPRSWPRSPGGLPRPSAGRDATVSWLRRRCLAYLSPRDERVLRRAHRIRTRPARGRGPPGGGTRRAGVGIGGPDDLRRTVPVAVPCCALYRTIGGARIAPAATTTGRIHAK